MIVAQRRARGLKKMLLSASAWTLFGCGAMPLFGTAAALAQSPTESAAPEARDQMYADVAREADALDKQLNLLKRVVRLVKPTVVHIEAKKVDEETPIVGRRRSVEEAGSGVIVELNKKFYVITNRHVIKDAPNENIVVNLSDGRKLAPQKVWSDRGSDIAVMQINASNLVAARIGDSDKLEIGDYVIAVGSPFGLSHSVTHGIISAKGRRDLQLGTEGVKFQDFLQTDAAINPGNSGGPLINLRGEVVGINTAIASSSGGNEGIGFTIPINMAAVVVRQLVENGTVVRAFLGVQLDSKFGPDEASRIGLPQSRGARVSGITPDSPAERAQLKIGDVIMRVGDVLIDDDNHVVNMVSLTPVGKELNVTLFRDGKVMSVKVKVGDRQRFDQLK